LPGDLKEKVVEIKRTANDDMNLILAVRDLVIDSHNHKEIPMEYTGFQIRTPGEVWQSGWATPAEKALLISELLVEAGINAEPIGIIPDEWFNDRSGNLYYFEDYCVQVNPVKMDRIYLSVHRKSDQNLIFNLDDYTLIQLDAAVETMRKFNEAGDGTELTLAGHIKLDDSLKIHGAYEMELSNSKNPWFALSKDSSYSKKLLKGAGKVSIAEIEKLTQSKSNINLIATGEADTLSGYIFINLPVFGDGMDEWRLGTTNWERRSALKLPEQLAESYDFEIEIPEGMLLVNKTVERNLKNETGEVVISVNSKGGKLHILRSIALHKKLYQINEIRQLKELIETWNMPDGRKIVLKGSE
jgi:hypothetical protein